MYHQALTFNRVPSFTAINRKKATKLPVWNDSFQFCAEKVISAAISHSGVRLNKVFEVQPFFLSVCTGYCEYSVGSLGDNCHTDNW